MSNKGKIGSSNPYTFRYGFIPSLFQNPGFGKRAMSNNYLSRQRWMHSAEVRNALQYLRELESNGAEMFWRHKVDGEGRLQHLFWCDGESRFDYKQFGDVLALDTSYGKSSKYLYPLVVFSGVNHHIHTTVFASAIIADETEDTYVWLFEQFKEAMEAKSPELFITKDDVALKNALGRVFPNATHRLCAQQILHNVSCKVRDPMITAQFKDLMTSSDYEVNEFNSKWDEMVTQFGLEDHSWVKDMYEKREMWATACIRGRCFVGYKASSRCEGLYAKFGRLARSCLNLVDFLQHFHHCFDELRNKELTADFNSVHGEPVLQTAFKRLERSASRVFTREVFMLFRPVLARAGTMKVLYWCKDIISSMANIYRVSEYGQPVRRWYVHYYPPHYDPPTYQYECDCKKMENFGIPCDHIVHVMDYLGIDEMPTSLVLKRWTKSAKEIVKGTFDEGDGTSLEVDEEDERRVWLSLVDSDEDHFRYGDLNAMWGVTSDESDADDGPTFKRRAQNNVDDEW